MQKFNQPGKIILVGGSGFIGYHLLKYGESNYFNMLPLFNSKSLPNALKFNMLTDDLGETIGGINDSDVVILLAAYSDQSWISHNIKESRELNVIATIKLISTIKKTGAFLIYLSSEAVFGINTKMGWIENDETSPISEYGKQKLEVENYINEIKFGAIVRTGWVIGWEYSNRCPIVQTYNILLNKEPKIAKDNFLTFTDVNDLVKAIFRLIEIRVNKTFHFVSNSKISRVTIADTILSTSKNIKLNTYQLVLFNSFFTNEKRCGGSWLKPSDLSLSLCADFSTDRKFKPLRTCTSYTLPPQLSTNTLR